jgi:hypothetical protein
MNPRRELLVSLTLAVALTACTGPRVGGLGDGGTDGGSADTGPAPGDVVFSLGVTDNASGPPQTGAPLRLLFGHGTPASDTVVARRIEAPPAIDGDGADWTAVPASTLTLVGPAAAIGMSRADYEEAWADAGVALLRTGRAVAPWDFGVASVQMKAAYDDANLYFLVSWSDPIEDRRAGEWFFDGSDWSPSTANSDRLYLAFNIDSSFADFDVAGCTAACHVKERLGDTSPAGISYRFSMHTSDAGERADVWSWRAATTDPMAAADDMYWDSLSRKGDGLLGFSAINRTPPDGGVSQPLYMSEGGINSNPESIFLPDAGSPLAVPFDSGGALAGARVPGSVQQQASVARAHVRAKGRWADGTWTVELTRALTTGDVNDAQFPLP